jgi:hypothetical protein
VSDDREGWSSEYNDNRFRESKPRAIMGHFSPVAVAGDERLLRPDLVATTR